MRDKDIKILWGRSGNRCAICKIELTPDGDEYTLGEMAHIVARSPDGPRGSVEISDGEIDDYSNLILLCPTHHAEIDKNDKKWSRQELLRIKNEHERWVSEQLGQGRISFAAIDNSEFISSRIENWLDFSNGKVWMAASITPLRVSGEIIDPLDDRIADTLNSIQLPSELSINAYHTRPNENGLVNEKVNNLNDGFAHRIQVFRNGHCEFLFCIQWSVDQITGYAKNRDSIKIGTSRVIRYTSLADAIEKGIIGLKTIWSRCLSLKDMTLNIVVLNTSHSIMYSKETNWNGALYGFPVESSLLQHTEIINDKDDTIEILNHIIPRFANYFGLVLDKIYDESGNYIRPKKM